MALVYVHCPECQSIDVGQYGKQANGTQRYRCNNRDCPRTIFLLQYRDKGRLPAVKQQIVDMTLNGSGVRDIVRVLRVSSATVINVLKKKEPAVKQVHARLLHTLDPPQVNVILRQVEQAEMDEMWSFVVGCLKVASRAQCSCPGFGPREPHSPPQYLGQLIGFSAEVLSSRGDQTSRHCWQLSHGPPC